MPKSAFNNDIAPRLIINVNRPKVSRKVGKIIPEAKSHFNFILNWMKIKCNQFFSERICVENQIIFLGYQPFVENAQNYNNVHHPINNTCATMVQNCQLLRPEKLIDQENWPPIRKWMQSFFGFPYEHLNIWILNFFNLPSTKRIIHIHVIAIAKHVLRIFFGNISVVII